MQVLCDSAACGLPVSSFPNIMAYGIVDGDGKQYLCVMDYIKAAAIVEALALVAIATVGWGMVQLTGI